jgi:hypothetical protein
MTANTRKADSADAILDFAPPVFRRFADSLAPHQNLVRAETAAELARIMVVYVYGITL